MGPNSKFVKTGCFSIEISIWNKKKNNKMDKQKEISIWQIFAESFFKVIIYKEYDD